MKSIFLWRHFGMFGYSEIKYKPSAKEMLEKQALKNKFAKQNSKRW